MADETHVSTIRIEDDFSATLDKAAQAAERFGQRVNKAFGSVKPGAAHSEVKKLEGGFASLAVKAGEAAALFGSRFGEGGKVVGEATGAMIKSIGHVGSALSSLRGTASKELSAFEHRFQQVARGTAYVGSGGARTSGLGGLGVLGGAARIAGALGPLGVGAGALTAAVGGVAAYGAIQSEKIEKMAQASGTTVQNFTTLKDILGSRFGVGLEETASLLERIHSGVQESTIAAREFSEMWTLIQDRISVAQERIKQGTVERQEAEHAASDQFQENQHSVQQAVQGTADAQERLQDAYSALARGGRKLTPEEQAAEGQKQRQRAVDQAERAVAQAQYAEEQARHKAADDSRKEDEARNQRELQARRERIMAERLEVSASRRAEEIEERGPAPLRAFLAAERGKGGDLTANIEKAVAEFSKLNLEDVHEQLRRVAEVVRSIPEGAEKERIRNANFGDQAAKIKAAGDDLEKALSPAEFEKLAKAHEGAAQQVEKQIEVYNKGVSVINDFNNAAIAGGASVNKLAEAALNAVSALTKFATPTTAPGHAFGGLIGGSGGPTQDNIPIMASAGEYIHSAASVSHYGRAFMDAVNTRRFASGGFIGGWSFDLPRFAGGGEVAATARSGSSGGSLHPVTIIMPSGDQITGLHGEPSAVASLSRHAVLRQMSSTGRKPSWYPGG